MLKHRTSGIHLFYLMVYGTKKVILFLENETRDLLFLKQINHAQKSIPG